MKNQPENATNATVATELASRTRERLLTDDVQNDFLGRIASFIKVWTTPLLQQGIELRCSRELFTTRHFISSGTLRFNLWRTGENNVKN